MFCPTCGTKLPDIANFCLNCGKNLRQNTHTPHNQYETCEIVFQVIPKGIMGRFWDISNKRQEIRFVAESFDANGTNIILQGESFYVYYEGDLSEFEIRQEMDFVREYLNRLTSQISQEGWEPLVSHGTAWYNRKFRRKIGSS